MGAALFGEVPVGQTLGQAASFRQTAPETRCQSRVCDAVPPHFYVGHFGQAGQSSSISGNPAQYAASIWAGRADVMRRLLHRDLMRGHNAQRAAIILLMGLLLVLVAAFFHGVFLLRA